MALNGRKPRKSGRTHAPERDSWAKTFGALIVGAPNSAARRQQHSRETHGVFDEG